MMNAQQNKGVTFVEILVTVSILLLLALLSFTAFQNVNKKSALRVSVQDVETALLEARNRTLASENDTVYGVHVDTAEVVVFSGATYSPAGVGNATTSLTGGVTATTSLTGGVTDVVFERLTGYAAATGTITLIAPSEGGTTTLTVHETGLVE